VNRRYLVELYVGRCDGAVDLEGRARSAVETMVREGEHVRFVRTVFVPGDQTCFQLYEARSASVVEEASRRAGIAFERVVAAVEP
jgi:hypothetical protein